MSDLISHQVLSKLGLVCFEYHWEGFFSCLGDAPQWAVEIFPCVRNRFPRILPGDISPFLENFIVDAIEFWQHNQDDLLRSGYWTETLPEGVQSSVVSGQEIHLEALVLNVQERPILLLEVSEIKFFETFHWLQTARKERLDAARTQKSNANQVLSSAFFDALTGLPNERSFGLNLSQWLEALRQGQKTSVLLLKLNLDGFRKFSINLGKPLSDQILIQLARRLKQIVGAGALVARCDADEYLLAVDHVSEQTWQPVLEQWMNILQSSYKLGSRSIFSTVCVGLVFCDPDKFSVEELLGQVSMALVQAKQRGRGQYCLFQPDLHGTVLEQFSQEQELLRAIQQQDFVCLFQPMYGASGKELKGLRYVWQWHHPHQSDWSESALARWVKAYGLANQFSECILSKLLSLETGEYDADMLYLALDFRVLLSPIYFQMLLDLNRMAHSLIVKVENFQELSLNEQSLVLKKLSAEKIDICLSMKNLSKIRGQEFWAEVLNFVALEEEQVATASRVKELLRRLKTFELPDWQPEFVIDQVDKPLNQKAIASLPVAMVCGNAFSKPLSRQDFSALLLSQ